MAKDITFHEAHLGRWNRPSSSGFQWKGYSGFVW